MFCKKSGNRLGSMRFHRQDKQGKGFLLLHGPEPDLGWKTFTNAVVDLVERFGQTGTERLGVTPREGELTAHPEPFQYVMIAVVLCVITALEVGIYYLPEDFTQAHDLAAEHPDKVQELKDLFWQEAEQYKVPLVNPVAAKEEITRQGYKYVFRVSATTATTTT